MDQKLQGFALGDLIIYIPLLGFGLLTSNHMALSAALGISLYWPIGKIFVTLHVCSSALVTVADYTFTTVCLAAAINAQGAPGWSLDDTPFFIVLPTISLWAAWCLWHLSLDQATVLARKKH